MNAPLCPLRRAGGEPSPVSFLFEQITDTVFHGNKEWARPWERTVEVSLSAALCYVGRGVTLIDLDWPMTPGTVGFREISLSPLGGDIWKNISRNLYLPQPRTSD